VCLLKALLHRRETLLFTSSSEIYKSKNQKWRVVKHCRYRPQKEGKDKCRLRNFQYRNQSLRTMGTEHALLLFFFITVRGIAFETFYIRIVTEKCKKLFPLSAIESFIQCFKWVCICFICLVWPLYVVERRQTTNNPFGWFAAHSRTWRPVPICEFWGCVQRCL
jgi:hypothetical protein